MQVIPLQPVPSQTLQVQLGSQATILNVWQTAYGLFVTVYVGNTLIVASVIAENLNRIVRSAYLGFVGDLAFIDTQALGAAGPSDPVYTGLGARYQLLYLDEADLASLGLEG